MKKKLLLLLLLIGIGVDYAIAADENWDITCSMRCPVGGDYFNFGWTSINTNSYSGASGICAISGGSSSKIVVYSKKKKIKAIQFTCNGSGFGVSTTYAGYLTKYLKSDVGVISTNLKKSTEDNTATGTLSWSTDDSGKDYVEFYGTSSFYITSFAIKFGDEDTTPVKVSKGDIDGNGVIDVTDVTELINIIFNK